MCQISFTCGLSKESGRIEKGTFYLAFNIIYSSLYWLYIPMVHNQKSIQRYTKNSFSHSWKIHSVLLPRGIQQHQFLMYFSKANFVIYLNCLLQKKKNCGIF